MEYLPQPIAQMSIGACQASGRLCLFTYSPGKTVRDKSMARYATGTATAIRPQQDSKPVLTGTFQQVTGMEFSIVTKPNQIPQLENVYVNFYKTYAMYIPASIANDFQGSLALLKFLNYWIRA